METKTFLVYYNTREDLQYVLEGDPQKDDPVTIAYREIDHTSDPDLSNVYLVEGVKINGVVYLPIDWYYNLSGQSVAEWAEDYEPLV